MWESRRDFQRVWEGWEAGFLAFHAFHTLSFPRPAFRPVMSYEPLRHKFASSFQSSTICNAACNADQVEAADLCRFSPQDDNGKEKHQNEAENSVLNQRYSKDAFLTKR
jgi:hypothetical protein